MWGESCARKQMMWWPSGTDSTLTRPTGRRGWSWLWIGWWSSRRQRICWTDSWGRPRWWRRRGNLLATCLSTRCRRTSTKSRSDPVTCHHLWKDGDFFLLSVAVFFIQLKEHLNIFNSNIWVFAQSEMRKWVHVVWRFIYLSPAALSKH